MADQAGTSTSVRPQVRQRASWWRMHRRHILALIVAVLLLAGAYAATVNLYVSAQKPGANVYEKNAGNAQLLKATVSVVGVDPATRELTVSIDVRPAGSLAKGDGVSVTRPVHVEEVGPRGPAGYDVPAGGHLSPLVVNAGMSGTESSYPFDEYHASLLVSVGSPPVAADRSPAIPAFIFNGSYDGYRVTAVPMPRFASRQGVLGVNVLVRRASVTIVFAVMMLVLQGLLAAAAASATFLVFRQRWRAETALLTWLAAMLFAIVPLREAMPGAPPIGAEIDILVFLWAVAIIVLSLIAVFFVWARRAAPASSA